MSDSETTGVMMDSPYGNEEEGSEHGSYFLALEQSEDFDLSPTVSKRKRSPTKRLIDETSHQRAEKNNKKAKKPRGSMMIEETIDFRNDVLPATAKVKTVGASEPRPEAEKLFKFKDTGTKTYLTLCENLFTLLSCLVC